ncbi:hypothetical protein BU14_0235s0005 [Porphyra umbilicalis]|uniref:C2H2-type domain-containing protein n=1 Tax=Porphyra umbilicalis TaxID=2786 RepID=A0A1X6P3V3_PORUM|nr:hypothetical protein BU14_0235s0005 [Porphyra umbilicalis]|eukprot:OSX75456.1 hypothetical protein BU14_0235s0005 [Porphyra umbilicalis]
MDAFAMELMQQVPSFLPTMPSTAAAVKTADQDAYGTADDPFFTLPPPPATAAAVAAAVVDAAAAEAGGSTGSSPALTPAMWALRVLAPRPTPVARSNLTAHSRLHNNSRPYPCPVGGCGKRFRWMSALAPHTRMHARAAAAAVPRSPAQLDADRIYACGVCGRRFARRTSVTNHERSHGNVRSAVNRRRRRGGSLPASPAPVGGARSAAAPPGSDPPPPATGAAGGWGADARTLVPASGVGAAGGDAWTAPLPTRASQRRWADDTPTATAGAAPPRSAAPPSTSSLPLPSLPPRPLSAPVAARPYPYLTLPAVAGGGCGGGGLGAWAPGSPGSSTSPWRPTEGGLTPLSPVADGLAAPFPYGDAAPPQTPVTVVASAPLSTAAAAAAAAGAAAAAAGEVAPWESPLSPAAAAAPASPGRAMTLGAAAVGGDAPPPAAPAGAAGRGGDAAAATGGGWPTAAAVAAAAAAAGVVGWGYGRPAAGGDGVMERTLQELFEL